MTKDYHIENDDLTWEMTVRIDHEKADKPIKEMVEFWGGWKEKLKDSDGDYTKAFLKMLGVECYKILVAEDLTIDGLIRRFSTKEQKEGWYQMDGSDGIEILDADSVEIEEYMFTVTP